MSKIVLQGKESINKLLKGIDIVGEVVGSTLGPNGKNVVIEREYGYPQITNDGVSIAKEIILGDEVENLGAQILIEAAKKTNDHAGDGTTSSVVLTHSLIKNIRKDLNSEGLLSDSVNVVAVFDDIKKWCGLAVKELSSMAKPVKTKEEIADVATISLQNRELGETMADILDKIGKDGYILVEPSFNRKLETEVVQGMKVNASFVKRWMITDSAKKESVFPDPLILITNSKIDDPLKIQGLVQSIVAHGKKELVIIASSYAEEVIASIFQTAKQGFSILALRAPAIEEADFEDIGIYTDGKFFDQRKGDDYGKATYEDLGRADKIAVNEDSTFIIGPKGNEVLIQKRIQEVKELAETEKLEVFKKKDLWRAASLASGIGIIRVGAKTDFERDALKAKIDDAVYATRAAMEEGVVPGGGLALKMVSEKLDKNVLTETLTAPYNKIKENAGKELVIGEDVVDPLRVVRESLENACSAAGQFLTVGSVIARKKQNFEAEFKKMMA